MADKLIYSCDESEGKPDAFEWLRQNKPVKDYAYTQFKWEEVFITYYQTLDNGFVKIEEFCTPEYGSCERVYEISWQEMKEETVNYLMKTLWH